MYGHQYGLRAIGDGEEVLREDEDVNVLVLAKGGERFVVFYRDDQREDALRAFGRWAANPELSFSWCDAAVLSQKVRGSV
jgi:hypothetical protein